MDDKGFISIEYLFSLFIVIIIACGMLFYTSASISSSLTDVNGCPQIPDLYLYRNC